MTHNIDRLSRTRTTLAAVLLAVAVLVTTFGTRPAAAALPGENGRIVFESLDLSNFNYDIYTVDADGSNPTPLTGGAAEDRAPAVSPDGKKIAFASNRDGAYAIYVMNLDGSDPTRLTDEPGTADFYPSWSPDGEKLVFARTILAENNPEIYVVDADGSDPTRLTSNAAFDNAPAFSPDGSKIAFSSLRDGDSEVFVMDSDGSNPTNLTDNTVYDSAPNWSPDGSKITFISQRDGGDNDVFVMGDDGSDPTNLTNNGDDDYDPAFSPDGSRIAFSSNRDGDAELYAMNAADGSGVTRLTDGPTLGQDPDWQPLLDTTPPTVSLAAPADGRAVSGSGVILAADASDEKGVARVDFYVGPQKVGTDSTAGGINGQRYVTTWDSTTVSDGAAVVEARAYDAAGNEKVSASRTITVDNTAPVAPTISSPADGSYDRDGTFVVSGFAEPGSTIRLFDRTTLLGTTTAGSTGSWKKKLTGVKDGRHGYRATATDRAGNASPVSSPRRVTVDTVEPAVKAVAPADGATNVGIAARVKATFSEAMNSETVTASTVKLIAGGTTAKLSATVSYDAATRVATLDPSSNLQPGQRYTARVTTGARDLAGNPLSAAKTWSFTVRR